MARHDNGNNDDSYSGGVGHTIKAHLAVLGAEIDQVSPPELVKQFEEILSSNSEFESYVKIFPGVAHGWTVRYDVKDKAAVKKAEEAHTDAINWFEKHLK